MHPATASNSVRHFDQMLEAVSSLDVSLAEKFDSVTCVDEYTFGHCLHERNNLQSDEPFTAEMTKYVGGLVATGEYPQLAKLADELGLDEVWAQLGSHFRDEGRFDRNLARLIDGIEAGLARGGHRRRADRPGAEQGSSVRGTGGRAGGRVK